MKISSSPCKQSYRNVILETEKASLSRRENFWSTDESSASHEISRPILTGCVYHRPQFVTTFSVLPGQIFSEPEMIVLQVGGCFGCFPYSISVDSGGELHDDASGSGATLSLGSESVSMTSGSLWFCSGRTDWHISITFPLTSSFSASLTPCSLRFHLLEYLSNSDILCWQLSTRPSSLVTFFFPGRKLSPSYLSFPRTQNQSSFWDPQSGAYSLSPCSSFLSPCSQCYQTWS